MRNLASATRRRHSATGPRSSTFAPALKHEAPTPSRRFKMTPAEEGKGPRPGWRRHDLITFREFDVKATSPAFMPYDFLRKEHPDGIDADQQRAGIAMDGFNATSSSGPATNYGTSFRYQSILPLTASAGPPRQRQLHGRQAHQVHSQLRDAFIAVKVWRLRLHPPHATIHKGCM